MCNRYTSPTDADIERAWQYRGHGMEKLVASYQGKSGEPGQTASLWDEPEPPTGEFGRRGVYPRSPGLFIRASSLGPEFVIGQWGLIPHFAESARLPYSTNNARFEEITRKASFRQAWAKGQRCIIPAESFDEPCWETGRNVWWTFRRADGHPWALAGLWNRWTDHQTGEVIESYTMLTMNADTHPLMRRMHKPDPKLPADQQDKRSVVVLEASDLDAWLHASPAQAAQRVRLAPVEVFVAQTG